MIDNIITWYNNLNVNVRVIIGAFSMMLFSSLMVYLVDSLLANWNWQWIIFLPNLMKKLLLIALLIVGCEKGIQQMENIGQIIIFLVSLYGAWISYNWFSMNKMEHANTQIKFFPKFPYMAGKLLGLFCFIFFISIMEKMLFYPPAKSIPSLKFSMLIVLAYSIGIFVKKKLSK